MISKRNAAIIVEYIASMQTEINPSSYYKRNVIKILCKLSQSNNDKPFEQITRQEVITFKRAYYYSHIHKSRKILSINLVITIDLRWSRPDSYRK